MNKLALGTVQFGLRYGVANISGQVAPAAIAAILQRAGQAGIDTLDTAIAYGDSEARLGEAGVSSWRVVTKLPSLPDGVSNVFEWVESQVRGSLQRLKIAGLDGLLLHKTADCVGPLGADYVRALNELKARGWVRSAGISIYDPSELDAVWPVWQPDIIQAPCNVLDRRLLQSGWLEKLRLAGVRLHVRSVFLQGLLLLPKSRRPESFAPWTTLLDRWLDWCVEHEITPPQAALGFILSLPGVERLVVGVDSGAQLDEILAATNAEVAVPPDDLYSGDRALIEPSRWKLT
jgi:aryl-alcohol dehydrogenase-like predicted oxidoreductase